MSVFTSNLHVEFLKRSDNFKLDQDVSFYSVKADKGLKTTLLKGFISDGDSTPTLLKPIVRASGNRYQIIYAFHDAWFRVYYHYYVNNVISVIPPTHVDCPNSYKMGNLLLDEGLEILGLGGYPRGKVYYGLQMFGRSTKNEAMIENALEYTKFEYIEIIDEKIK